MLKIAFDVSSLAHTFRNACSIFCLPPTLLGNHVQYFVSRPHIAKIMFNVLSFANTFRKLCPIFCQPPRLFENSVQYVVSRPHLLKDIFEKSVRQQHFRRFHNWSYTRVVFLPPVRDLCKNRYNRRAIPTLRFAFFVSRMQRDSWRSHH